MQSTTIQLAYGHRQVEFSLPTANLLGVIHPQEVSKSFDEAELLSAAMAHPIGTPRLRDMLRKGQKVAIITSDLTRPCPSDKLLPYIAAELDAAGVPDQDVFIVLALGLHRPMTEEEIRQAISPEIMRRYQALNHDPTDTIRLGYTSRGTPVEFFRPMVEEADFRICLGNIEFHYFAGFSGGAKAIFPGCVSRAAVTANHAMMVLPESTAGRNAGNPLREDIDEAVAMLGVDFILNVVLDEDHQICGAFAGEVTTAHRTGCEMITDRGTVKISRKADIVVAGTGGFPKDINFYQAHKALEGAKDFVREGGILILVAECREGIGNRTFESWLVSGQSPEEIISRIRREFVLGGHKAAAIAAIQQRAQIFVVSDLPPEIVRPSGLFPFTTLQQALDAAFQELSNDSQVLVIPQAVSVIPNCAMITNQ